MGFGDECVRENDDGVARAGALCRRAETQSHGAQELRAGGRTKRVLSRRVIAEGIDKRSFLTRTDPNAQHNVEGIELVL